jgi:5-(carboxyamino)imidazole ribonucleotide mutase
MSDPEYLRNSGSTGSLWPDSEPTVKLPRGDESTAKLDSDAERGSVEPVSVVGVVMGSDSDWPVMEAAVVALTEFGVAAEVDVVSAHRMPAEMLAYGRSAVDRGLRVLIAGAGGAAHLPGMLASVTPLPVIGVPVPLQYLDGMDSLLSIVQMPAGVPVATVAVGGARNAGLLAVRILAAGEGDEAARLRGLMVDFQARLAETARAKGEALRTHLQR